MTRARGRALLLATVAVAVALILGFAYPRDRSPNLPARPPGGRPVLLLLTSLPIAFGEEFSLHGGGSAALKALETRYEVVPISVTDPAGLAKGRLLLMAQPFAQPAEDLVALDAWVRRGGRLLLFADPMLEWPSEKPMGDVTRPPLMFADTGLLAHWGLRLDAPDSRGQKLEKLAGYDVLTVSPGQLSGECPVTGGGLAAHCRRIGAGKVTVVADADLLDVSNLDSKGRNNLNAVLAELAQLEQQ